MTQTQISNTILVAKDASVQIAVSICNKYTLGQEIGEELEELYTMQNCLNGMTYGGIADYTDANYNYIAELISRIATQWIKH